MSAKTLLYRYKTGIADKILKHDYTYTHEHTISSLGFII